MDLLPEVPVSTGAILRDDWGCLLLVKPANKSRWAIPGGAVDAEEEPRQAVHRQLRDELGLDRQPGDLLCVDVVPARQPYPRPEVLYLFDGGLLAAAEQETIRLWAREQYDWRFAGPVDLDGFILGLALRRLRNGLAAYEVDYTVDLEDGYPVPNPRRATDAPRGGGPQTRRSAADRHPAPAPVRAR